MIGFIILIVLGAIAGGIAKYIHPGKDPGGWIGTILVGIAGSYLGSFISKFVPFFDSSFGELSIGGIIMAAVGALLLLFIYRKVFS